MNHFMLPESDVADPGAGSARYGVYAMEVLINELIKRGARRERLEAKVFGGGNVLPDLSSANVGHRNAEFVLRFLATERVRVAAQDLADVHPRKVCYYPLRGRVLLKRLRSLHNDTIAQREADYRARIADAGPGGTVDLF
jgi:chemotaxis protein CheD